MRQRGARLSLAREPVVTRLLGVKRVLLLAALIGGCADETTTQPDASVTLLPDAAAATTDACVRDPSHGCCDLLPDEDAVRTCSYQGLAPGTCGVAVCWQADCSSVRLNFCAPS